MYMKGELQLKKISFAIGSIFVGGMLLTGCGDKQVGLPPIENKVHAESTVNEEPMKL